MNSIAMPSRALSSARSFRICACTVTSSAVVGSSAMKQVGLVGERHGDHHALALPARELVRIGVEPALGVADADEVEQLERARPRRRARTGRRCSSQDLADLPLDRVERVERGHRLLEHHGDVVAAHGAHLVLGGAHEVAALEQDLAGGMVRRRVGQELQDRERRDRLAGPGLADERHRLAGHHVERDAVDRKRLRPPWRKATERSRTERRGSVTPAVAKSIVAS